MNIPTNSTQTGAQRLQALLLSVILATMFWQSDINPHTGPIGCQDIGSAEVCAQVAPTDAGPSIIDPISY